MREEKDKKLVIAAKLCGIYMFSAMINFSSISISIYDLNGITNHYHSSLTYYDYFITLLTIGVLIVLAYGFLRLRRWSFWLVIMFNIAGAFLSIIFKLLGNQEMYQSNIFAIALLILFVFDTKKYFYKGE